MLNFLRILILALLVPAINKVYGIDQPKKVYKYERADQVGYPNESFILPRGQPYPILRASNINTDVEHRNRGKPNIEGFISYLNQRDSLPRNKGEPKKDTS